MKLSEIKNLLPHLDTLSFRLEDGTAVPAHFHITEVGNIHKHFIDCGGTVREENLVSFQLWDANDFEHRLKPAKLLHIIHMAEQALPIGDHEIEVEFQAETIGKYSLAFDGQQFILTNKYTACLADDQCGIPATKQKLSLIDLGNQSSSCCTPGGNCC